MTPKKDKLTVGPTTMWAETVPVRILYDEFHDNWDAKNGIERVLLLELDGYYLVAVENFWKITSPSSSFRCFIHEEDAWSYLEMFGIEKESKNE